MKAETSSIGGGGPPSGLDDRCGIDSALISARLDRLPPTRSMWTMVVLIAAGGFFEIYEMLLTGFIAPGLVQEGIFTREAGSVLSVSSISTFVASTFVGLTIGTMLFSFISDRLGRRSVFLWSLLFYSATSVIMVLQSAAWAISLWRLITGIGLGVEIVTISAYISELVPPQVRGRAFAVVTLIQTSAIPFVSFVSWQLVPEAPLGWAGWRWVVAIGVAGSLVIWLIRRKLPESPRWLATHGQVAEADRITATFEAIATRQTGPLPPPQPARSPLRRANFVELWRGKYRARTVMLSMFQALQGLSHYGFTIWLPTILVAGGHTVGHSLGQTFAATLGTPVGAALGIVIGDRIERKWQIIASAAAWGCLAFLLSVTRDTNATLVIAGLMYLCGATMNYAYLAYQSELFPTRIRSMGVGFTYSWSRVAAIFGAYFWSFVLLEAGRFGMLAAIAGSTLMIVPVIGLLGPATRKLSLEQISD